MDIINEKLHNIKVMGISTRFIWVPAHVGVDGNEKVAILAKQTLGIKQVDFQVPLSKAEAKVLNQYGRYTFIQYTKTSRCWEEREQESSIITRMRIGHTGLNSTLKLKNTQLGNAL